MKRFPRARLTLVAAATAAGLIGSLLVSTAAAAPARPTPASTTTSTTSTTATTSAAPTTSTAPTPGRGSSLPSGSGAHSRARLAGGATGSTPSSAGGPASGNAGAAATPAGAPSLSIAQSSCGADTSSAAGLQNLFNARGPVWGGGDGGQPIPIDGGRTLWLFGDTFIGGGPYGGPLTTTGVVHNSLVVQYNGNCFAYLLGNNGVSWSSAISEPSATDWYWPNDGTYDPSTGILSIVASHVRVTSGGQWGWAVLGEDVMHFRVEPEHHAGRAACSPTAAPTRPSTAGPSWSTAGTVVPLRLRPVRHGGVLPGPYRPRAWTPPTLQLPHRHGLVLRRRPMPRPCRSRR